MLIVAHLVKKFPAAKICNVNLAPKKHRLAIERSWQKLIFNSVNAGFNLEHKFPNLRLGSHGS
jgi:hypothetical protein